MVRSILCNPSSSLVVAFIDNAQDRRRLCFRIEGPPSITRIRSELGSHVCARSYSDRGGPALRICPRGRTDSETTGHLLGMAAVTNAGEFFDPFGTGSKMVIYVLGFIVLIIGALFAITGSRLYNKVMWAIFFVGVVGLAIEVPILLTTSHATFLADYAKYYAGGVPGVFSSAAKAGYLPGWTYAASIAAVPLLLINYGPYLFMYQCSW